tara:strand:- start:331 stop:735 length:405 start_codon:yes stop_codon:yes gene_type:complete
MENYSSVEKEIVKNNRKIFYREGLYVINSILEKKGDEISFVELKKIFRSNRYLRELYFSISNVGNKRSMYWDFYNFSDRYIINVNGMINYNMNDLNIVKKNNRLFLVKEDFSVLNKNYKMIRDSLLITRFVRRV